MIARFVDKIKEAPDIYTFRFASDKKVDYTAGQFIELTLQHDADDRGVRRWFTLSSSPTEDLLAITTKFTDKSSSYKRLLLGLKEGQEVIISDPMGDFVLPMDNAVPVTFIVGGIGVTPVRSMAKWLLDSEENRQMKILYSVSRPSDAAFLDLFDKAGIPTALISTEQSRLDADIILQNSQDTPEMLYYISGPEPMVEKLVDELTDSGIERQRLVTDYFLNYPTI